MGIGFGNQAIIADNQHTGISRVADQSASALLKGNNRLRDLDTTKRVAAFFTAFLQPGLQQRIIRRGKRQLVDHNAHQIITAYVYAFPERTGTKQYRRWVRQIST